MPTAPTSLRAASFSAMSSVPERFSSQAVGSDCGAERPWAGVSCLLARPTHSPAGFQQSSRGLG
eukprot:1405855-Alexandrium_andersonii.AAC.1